MSKQDAAFYVWEPGSEVVWQSNDCDFYVIRSGEMRIRYKPNTDDEQVIRYTDQLQDVGITNDAQLVEATDKEVLEWIHNAWFEVWHKEDSEWFSDPFHELQTAINYTQEATLEEYK